MNTHTGSGLVTDDHGASSELPTGHLGPAGPNTSYSTTLYYSLVYQDTWRLPEGRTMSWIWRGWFCTKCLQLWMTNSADFRSLCFLAVTDRYKNDLPIEKCFAGFLCLLGVDLCLNVPIHKRILFVTSSRGFAQERFCISKFHMHIHLS